MSPEALQSRSGLNPLIWTGPVILRLKFVGVRLEHSIMLLGPNPPETQGGW